MSFSKYVTRAERWCRIAVGKGALESYSLDDPIPDLVMKDIHLSHKFAISISLFPKKSHASLNFINSALSNKASLRVFLSRFDLQALRNYLRDAAEHGVFSLRNCMVMDELRLIASADTEFVSSSGVRFALIPDQYHKPVLRIRNFVYLTDVLNHSKAGFSHEYQMNEGGIECLLDMLLIASQKLDSDGMLKS